MMIVIVIMMTMIMILMTMIIMLVMTLMSIDADLTQKEPYLTATTKKIDILAFRILLRICCMRFLCRGWSAWVGSFLTSQHGQAICLTLMGNRI